jgi:hypothetical protein
VPHAAVPYGGPAGAVEPNDAHPLAASVAMVDRAVSTFSFSLLPEPRLVPEPVPGPRPVPELGTDEPWISCAQVLSDPAFFWRWRGVVARRLASQYGRLPGGDQVPEKTTAGHVLQWYLLIPSFLGSLLFHAARRVPMLTPDRLHFRLEAGVPQQVALHPGRFWCLPQDPAAGHPDAVPVPDEATLGAILREEVIAHATSMLAVYRPQLRFGRRTQWATVTDVLDISLLRAGRAFGSPQAGARDAQLVLGAGDKPLTSASTIYPVTDEHGRTHWIRRRGSCCFRYAVPGVPRPCVSCPRLSEADRVRILNSLPTA